MEREHVMILLDADMRTVHARLAKKFNDASLVQSGEHDIRNVETAVRFCHEAPEDMARQAGV